MLPAVSEAPVVEAAGIRPLGQGASDAWYLLNDQKHTEVFYGGSAGPGKTFLLCLWEVYCALRYPGTAGALFRESADNLQKSTLVTFFEVLTKSRLAEGVHWRYNDNKKVVEWYNGSVTYFDYLRFMPRDPNYSRLGGRQYTRAGVDESDQVEERAVDVLASRIRYRLTEFCHHCAAPGMASMSEPVDCDDAGNPTQWRCYKCGQWTKGLLPKLGLTGNPGDYWTKYRYVMTQDGEPVRLQPHQAKVLVLLEDNPDKAHVAVYRQQLERSSSDYDRQRLLHGDWMATKKTGREFFHAFEGARHLGQPVYDPKLAMHFTMDFNTAPYITGLLFQIAHLEAERLYEVRWLQELCLAHPYADTSSLALAVRRELTDGRYKGHEAGLFYYGDASGKNKTTQVVQGIRHNYDIVQRDMRPFLHNNSDRVLRRNPPHTIVRDFGNAALRGDLPMRIVIHRSMAKTTMDMIEVKEDADGGILKITAKDPATGVTYEKYGHCLQAFYYGVVGAFPSLFDRFVRRL